MASKTGPFQNFQTLVSGPGLQGQAGAFEGDEAIQDLVQGPGIGHLALIQDDHMVNQVLYFFNQVGRKDDGRLVFGVFFQKKPVEEVPVVGVQAQSRLVKDEIIRS